MAKYGSLGMKATLTDVNYNESSNFNLISLTRMICRGWNIKKGNATGITITHGSSGSEIDFDIVTKTAKVAIFARRYIQDAEVSASSTDTGMKTSITKAHEPLGHVNEDSVREMGKNLQWKCFRRKLKPCKHCTKSKAKQNNFSK